MSKVFLSYCHEDEDFVRELYNRLKRDGVECFFDKESIGGGVIWGTALKKELMECDFFVPILTPDYCRSKWCKIERTLFKEVPGNNDKIIPLLLKECGGQLPQFLREIQFIDVSTDEKFNRNYPAICRKLGGLYPPCSLPRKHYMPFRSLGDLFAGRVADLWKVDDGLRQRRTAVVQGVGIVEGMGGIGKTQLAVEYVHRFGWCFTGGVFWVDAETGRPAMIARVAENAEIKLDNTLDEKRQLEMLWKGLAGESVLVVLDNFPDGEDIGEWLPAEPSVHTLVTSRRKDFYNYFSLDLQRLDKEEALALLNSGGRTFEAEEASPLIDAVEGLPLALELVKHFLNDRKELSIPRLLEEMEKLGQMDTLAIFTEKYANQLPTNHDKAVAATFRMGWDLASPFEQKVLSAMSLLAPAPVPRRLLRKILGTNLEAGLLDPLDEALSRLSARLSMVELDQDADPRMHRLISAFVRTVTAEDDPLHTGVIAAVVEEMKRTNDEKDTTSFRELEKVLPHADAVSASLRIEPGQAVDIANCTGLHHKKLGRYRRGEHYRRKALAMAKSDYPPGAPEITRQQSSLAVVLRYLGELQEARGLLQDALGADKKTYPPGHPEIAKKQSNLALVLRDLGEHEEARDLLRDALKADENIYPPGHPNIARRRSNLAMVLRILGELQEAHDLLWEALEADQKNFPPGHPIIARRQSNLALTLQDLGELEEAHDLLRDTLEANQKIYPPGHPSIAGSQSHLAMVLNDLGEFEDARSLLWDALEADQKTFQTGHPSIAIRQMNLGMVLADLAEFGEAKELLILAYHSLLENLGPHHPKTKKAKKNLEVVMRRAKERK